MIIIVLKANIPPMFQLATEWTPEITVMEKKIHTQKSVSFEKMCCNGLLHVSDITVEHILRFGEGYRADEANKASSLTKISSFIAIKTAQFLWI